MTLPLCVRIDAADERSAINLKNDGWREIEVLETYRGTVAGQINYGITLAVPTDISWMQDLACEKFKLDRLHTDPIVPELDARQEKRAWVERAQYDADSIIWKYAEEQGFLIARWDGDDFVIDLLCVANPRRGIATALIRHGMFCCVATHVRAGTQSMNEPGKALYKSLGMEIMKRQRTFHK